jgi:hypothetical protein
MRQKDAKICILFPFERKGNDEPKKSRIIPKSVVFFLQKMAFSN